MNPTSRSWLIIGLGLCLSGAAQGQQSRRAPPAAPPQAIVLHADRVFDGTEVHTGWTSS